MNSDHKNKNINVNKIFLLCAAVSIALTFGDFAGGVAYAAPEASETTESALTDEELSAYYKDSVFIGDSIMLGFRNYSARQKTFVHDIQFLAAGSYSALNAMKPVTSDSVHPMYKGKKCQVWKAIPQIGSKRAFILLGMNDISILGLEGARDKYMELIGKILETSPDIEIHIISVTYTLPDQGKGKLNNKNLAQYNVLLQEMAEENGWGYLDLCTLISDGKGNLAEKYCSDGYVHLTNAAYTLWESALIDYANEQAAQAEEENGTETQTETMTDQETAANPADSGKTTPAAETIPATQTTPAAGTTPATQTTPSAGTTPETNPPESQNQAQNQSQNQSQN